MEKNKRGMSSPLGPRARVGDGRSDVRGEGGRACAAAFAGAVRSGRVSAGLQVQKGQGGHMRMHRAEMRCAHSCVMLQQSRHGRAAPAWWRNAGDWGFQPLAWPTGSKL